MKLRKFISWIVTATVIMTNVVVISMPMVSAETVSSETEYFEDFEGRSGNFQKTLLALKDYGWYMADNQTLYTTVEAVAPYKTYNYKLARLLDQNGSQCLQIVSAGANVDGTDNTNENTPNFGYAKTFPGVTPGEGATGVWEISFDFKPGFVNYSTDPAKPVYGANFDFSFNTTDGSAASETAAQHTIVAGYGGNFYLGYRDYEQLKKNVRQYTIKASDYIKSTASAWLSVKTILNCDAHYYTVEFYEKATGNLIARRGPVSFSANETVGCVKFSAKGEKWQSYAYIDNLSIKRTSREATIYNETFDTFTDDSYASAEGMTTETEDVKGTSYFKGYTPWRHLNSIGNSYAFESDETLGSQVVRLGDKAETTEETEASGLVYLQVNEPLLTQATQESRGTLKASFKVKPETIADDFSVNINPTSNIDIADDKYAIFKIVNDEGTFKIQDGSKYVELSSSQWYDVELSFDVVARKVSRTVKDLEGTTVLSNTSSGNSAPNAIRGIMFKAAGGTSVLVDDIKLEYITTTPSVDKSKIVATDRFGEKVTDINNVTTALSTIEIPFGAPIDSKTANSDTIMLADSYGNPINYTGSVSKNSYIIKLDDPLVINEEYTVTIPETVSNIFGDMLGEEVTFTFKTLNKIMDISAVNVNGEPFTSLYDIEAGSVVTVEMSYLNGTNTDVNSDVILAFYGNDGLINMQSVPFTVPAYGYGLDSETIEFVVPREFDIDAVDSMSIFVWDGLKYLSPLSRSISAKKKVGEAGKFRNYVDFEVNVEGGREPVILQLTDPQIIDSSQRREGNLNNTAAINFWLPELMNRRLFADLKALINKVNPDLILMTGDLVYGGYDDAGTSLMKLADFMDQFDIPWAPVFGNHDNESTMGVDWQCDYLENCENCLFKQRALTGNGNYSIGIVQGGELKRVIFMVDSNGCGVMSDESLANGHSTKEKGFGADQIEWYTSVANKINEKFGNMKYTFAFHIQLAAFEDAFAAYGFDNDGEKVPDGELNHGDFVNPINIDELENKKDTDFGYIGRGLKTPWDQDKTVYNGMKALGADSILVGHEHCNSASVVYDGIRFQYGQKIGEYDRINFKNSEGKIAGASAYTSELGTPVLGGTVMKLSEETGAISDAYIEYCNK